jgi:hypothetical protein
MGAGGAVNPAFTPQVQGMEGLAQASQNEQEGAALPTNQPAATAETPTAHPSSKPKWRTASGFSTRTSQV